MFWLAAGTKGVRGSLVSDYRLQESGVSVGRRGSKTIRGHLSD